MDESLLASYPALFGIIGALVALGTLGTSIYFGLRKGKTEVLTSKQLTEKYIDDKVAENLKLAWDRNTALEAKVTALSTKLEAQDTKLEEQDRRIGELEQSERDAIRKSEAAVRETEQLRGAVRRWWGRLVAWHEAGHPGDLPMPADNDIRLLDLADLPA